MMLGISEHLVYESCRRTRVNLYYDVYMIIYGIIISNDALMLTNKECLCIALWATRGSKLISAK